MFNFFKEAFKPKVDTKVVIEEIHNAFDNAGERLLNEAKGILAKGFNADKGERLKKLGFIKAKDAVEAAAKIKEQKEKEELATLIEYYQTFYPNNKFITEKEVEKICKKYGLLCGEVRYYIGDVPDKNVSEIANFNLREEDCTKHTCGWYKYEYNGGMRGYHLPSKKGDGSYGWINSDWRRGDRLHIVDESQEAHFEKPEFSICASVKDFDMNQMRVTEGYKLEQNIPDPIVLQPVKGGYLIVSKWGLESEDETLVNEKMN